MTARHDEDLDAEGIPPLEERPPGVDIETDEEGMIPPRDHPIAAGDDPAYPTTAAEQRRPEPLVERAERELPDFGARELGVGGSVQGADYRRSRAEKQAAHEAVEAEAGDEPPPGRVLGSASARHADLEAAVLAEDDLEERLEEEDDLTELASIHLIAAEGDDEFGTGERGELIGLTADDDGAAASGEEAAMHIEPEP